MDSRYWSMGFFFRQVYAPINIDKPVPIKIMNKVKTNKNIIVKIPLIKKFLNFIPTPFKTEYTKEKGKSQMSRRKKLSQKTSKRIFSAAGAKVNSLNTPKLPMRGGYRI